MWYIHICSGGPKYPLPSAEVRVPNVVMPCSGNNPRYYRMIGGSTSTEEVASGIISTIMWSDSLYNLFGNSHVHNHDHIITSHGITGTLWAFFVQYIMPLTMAIAEWSSAFRGLYCPRLIRKCCCLAVFYVCQFGPGTIRLPLHCLKWPKRSANLAPQAGSVMAWWYRREKMKVVESKDESATHWQHGEGVAEESTEIWKEPTMDAEWTQEIISER